MIEDFDNFLSKIGGQPPINAVVKGDEGKSKN